MDTLHRIYRELQSLGIGRDGVVVAVGGGVVGDLAGFAAATYMRGIDYVQIPTTLLAMVDSSVGGKTGVNLPEGKNMVGAFHQPRAVFSDLRFLDTLAGREVAAAMAEIIKYGLIRDREFYGYIEKNREAIANLSKSHVGYLVQRCCRFKADIVALDEREQGLRGILNFGHTLGHALETYTRYKTYLHGEAVALGSLAMVRYAADKGCVEPSFVDNLSSLLAFFGLPTHIPRDFDVNDVMSHLHSDKKRRRGVNQWITLKGVGEPHMTENVETSEIAAILKDLMA
ncbi:MAG: 3-dehydroquinate synthase [Deltaproteobacteria bacterium]|nr:3-dehydroquinate synthase [Deltaproteobacteria bacterium]